MSFGWVCFWLHTQKNGIDSCLVFILKLIQKFCLFPWVLFSLNFCIDSKIKTRYTENLYCFSVCVRITTRYHASMSIYLCDINLIVASLLCIGFSIHLIERAKLVSFTFPVHLDFGREWLTLIPIKTKYMCFFVYRDKNRLNTPLAVIIFLRNWNV